MLMGCFYAILVRTCGGVYITVCGGAVVGHCGALSCRFASQGLQEDLGCFASRSQACLGFKFREHGTVVDFAIYRGQWAR